MNLFPFNDYWHIYLFFSLFVTVAVVIDLGFFQKSEEAVSFKSAAKMSAFWIGLSLLANVIFYFWSLHEFQNEDHFQNLFNISAEAAAKKVSLEFFAGYLIEKALSIDNLFVFVMVFASLGIPKKYQHKVLYAGIIGAFLFRGVFIAIGSVIMQLKFVVLFFGALLIYTGIKMAFSNKEEIKAEENKLILFLKRYFPLYPKIEDSRFFRNHNNRKHITPLFVALISIEIFDIIFALDSVPAVFGVSKEPMVVFMSNVFAILGLRSLYFLIMSSLSKFAFIKYGISSILIFVGLKMVYLNEQFDGEFPIVWSLGIISGLLFTSILTSKLVNTQKVH